MARQRSTTTRGQAFDQATVNYVWTNGEIVPGNDASVWRKDECGAWMHRPSYGQTTTFGWEVDHIVPVSKGGSDALDNLQPLQWENNRRKGDDYPSWSCAITAK